MKRSGGAGARAALNFGEGGEALNDAGRCPTLVIVRGGVVALEERHCDADIPARLEDAIYLRDDEVRGADVF